MSKNCVWVGKAHAGGWALLLRQTLDSPWEQVSYFARFCDAVQFICLLELWNEDTRDFLLEIQTDENWGNQSPIRNPSPPLVP